MDNGRVLPLFETFVVGIPQIGAIGVERIYERRPAAKDAWRAVAVRDSRRLGSEAHVHADLAAYNNCAYTMDV